jgi:hypothetical protein
VDKSEFHHRLEAAAVRCRLVAERYVLGRLPASLLFVLPEFDDPRGTRGPAGTIKYFGGRFVDPVALRLVDSRRAVDFLWVDGRVPSWVNLAVEAVSPEATVIRVECSRTLVIADESALLRDLLDAIDPTSPVEPFRVRGPALPPGWRSLEMDGPIQLPRTRTHDGGG